MTADARLGTGLRAGMQALRLVWSPSERRVTSVLCTNATSLLTSRYAAVASLVTTMARASALYSTTCDSANEAFVPSCPS